MPFPPLGVPADMLSAVKKWPNLRSAGYARPPLGVPADSLERKKFIS